MNIEQIASRISELTGEQVSSAQLTNLPEKSKDGFKPITSRLEVLTTYNRIPNCVNFHVTGKPFNKYQSSAYGAKSMLEAWTELLTTFEDMLVNPNRYWEFGDGLFDST